MTQLPNTQSSELQYCHTCIQMTNHSIGTNGGCLKCRGTQSSELEDIDELTYVIQREQKGNISYMAARDAAWMRTLTKITEQVRQEERQYILNLLDGVDKADLETGNTNGGTKALRFMLSTRIIKQK